MDSLLRWRRRGAFLIVPPLLVLGSVARSAPDRTGHGNGPPAVSAPLVRGIGERRLGIAVAPPEDGDYAKAFAAAQSAGMQSVTLSLDWSAIEPSAGRYVDTNLDIADRFYPAHHTAVDIVLRPVNTNRLELPADLAGKPLDSPEVIARFDALIDHVLVRLRNVDIASLAIGNEVDAAFGADGKRWAQFERFFHTAAGHARSLRKGVPVGVVATFGGLTGAPRRDLKPLEDASDIVMVTYYPLNADFTVRSPSSPIADFDRLCRLYPGRPIVVTEAGYPSSAVCGSSEEKQAAFVRSLFTAWDVHVDQIQSITISWLEDLSPSAAGGYGSYYGIGSNRFREYLRTLGLRTYAGGGSDKQAFVALRREASARGWLALRR